MNLLDYLGRFHLIALHLPIGFLLLAFLMELANRKSVTLRPAVGFSLFWGAASAVAAAGFGYLLALNGDYDEELLSWHQWLGFVTAGLSVALCFFYKKRAQGHFLGKIYLPFFVITVVALVAAGHFGGSLTHGKDFLFEKKAPENVGVPAQEAANLDSAEIFPTAILPLLKEKCASCHNPSKRKGGLVLLAKDDILKGGKNGQIITLANLSESPLLKSIHAPLPDDLHMPPNGKKQLTPHEMALLEWWVGAGAPFEKKIADCALPPEIQQALSAKWERKTSPLAAVDLPPVSAGELEKLQQAGISVRPIAEGSPFLQVSLAHRKDLSDDIFKKIKSIGKNIVQLDLRNSNVTDEMLPALKNLPHLNRLHLDQTAISDKGLAHLAGLDFLEYLNIYGTKTTDTGLKQLENLKNLKSAYLWQTGVTGEGLARFVAARPEVFVNQGIENDSIFGDVGLKPPAVEASKDLFTDTVHVVLKNGFGKAAVHFTLDGSEPDSTSPIYEKPLVLQATTILKAISHLKGWSKGQTVERQFIKVRYQPQKIALAKQPDPKYAGDGGKSLGDLKRGTLNFGAGSLL